MEAPIKNPKRSFINNKQAISFFSLVLLLLHFFLTLFQTLEFWNIFSSTRFRVSVVSSLFSIHLTLEASLLHHIFHTHHLLLCSCSNEILCIAFSPAPVAYVLCVLFVFIFIFFSFKHFVDSHFLLVLLLAFHSTSPSHRPQPRPASPAKHLVSCDALFHTTAAPATTQNVYTKNEVLIFSDCHDVHWFSLSVCIVLFRGSFLIRSFFGCSFSLGPFVCIKTAGEGEKTQKRKRFHFIDNRFSTAQWVRTPDESNKVSKKKSQKLCARVSWVVRTMRRKKYICRCRLTWLRNV